MNILGCRRLFSFSCLGERSARSTFIFDDAGIGPIFDDSYGSRKGHWYIAIEVYNDLEKDCLQVDALSREAVLKYLRTLKQEYLITHNYNETVFKN